jgi:drug/metabolite transporter (DMT)-like permease
MRRGVGLALLSAGLFGLGTPLAKSLLHVSDPWMLAGLLYLGSGTGLGAYHLLGRLRGRPPTEAPLRAADLPWAAGAILAGGVIGPVLLMLGLSAGSASGASLLLNLEGVATAALAWLVFREHVSVRIAVGMLTILAGALVLGVDGRVGALDRSAFFVAGACVAWAVDNNLVRRISGSDPVELGALKGLAAGSVNVVLAWSVGGHAPAPAMISRAAVLGLLSYGVSFVLFVLALRHLGSARTTAYYSTAPFIGTLGAVALLGERPSWRLVTAGALMAVGVWLHLSERHAHAHHHDPLEHDHLHSHDAHHQHAHAPGTAPGEPHRHPHVHGPLHHAHPHVPDLHHRHPH